MARSINVEVKDNPERPCPPEILSHIAPVEVSYLGFDGKIHPGVLEIHEALAGEAEAFFERALEMGFPIEKVVRSSDPAYAWDDDKLMSDNATSGFNYRNIPETNKVSNHALGLAFDVNTHLNPYITYWNEQEKITPTAASWNKDLPGTLHAGHSLVKFMESLGWFWGGHWTPAENRMIDYQHFEKPHA